MEIKEGVLEEPEILCFLGCVCVGNPVVAGMVGIVKVAGIVEVVAIVGLCFIFFTPTI